MTRTVLDAKISFWFDDLKINLIRINHSIVEWNYPRHSHGKNFYELHYIDGGKGWLVCEDGEYQLENGMFIMTVAPKKVGHFGQSGSRVSRPNRRAVNNSVVIALSCVRHTA